MLRHFPYYPQIASRTSCSAAAVYGFLESRAGSARECIATQTEIVTEVQLDKVTVRRAIQKLSVAGYIEVVLLPEGKARLFRLTGKVQQDGAKP